MRPLVDPSRHALGVGEALVAEPGCDLGAAAAVVTVDHQGDALVGGELGHAGGELAHRDQLIPLDGDQLVLVGLAAVDQRQSPARGAKGVDLVAGDLEGKDGTIHIVEDSVWGQDKKTAATLLRAPRRCEVLRIT